MSPAKSLAKQASLAATLVLVLVSLFSFTESAAASFVSAASAKEGNNNNNNNNNNDYFLHHNYHLGRSNDNSNNEDNFRRDNRHYHNVEKENAPEENKSYWVREMDRVRRYASHNYIQRMRRDPRFSELPSGLLFSVVRRGHGDQAPALHEACEVRYEANFRFRYKAFFEGTQHLPYPPRRAPKDFVPGVQEAMMYMREGDVWSLIVPYHLAYGAAGNATVGVPPLSNMRYTLEVLRCPQTLSGRRSGEIDAVLEMFSKQPLLPKSPQVDYSAM